MDAHAFYREFMHRICDKPELVRAYRNSKEYTALIMHLINEIIADLGRNYNIENSDVEQQSVFGAQNEYLRIDACGWQSRYKSIEKQAKELGLKPHLWDLKIAVEHENAKNDWMDEVIKLVHIKCPTKVVIGYSNADDRKNDIHKLAFAAKCMNDVQAFHKGENEEYLIILGNAKVKGEITNCEQFGYQGHIYNRKTQRFDLLS